MKEQKKKKKQLDNYSTERFYKKNEKLSVTVKDFLTI